LPDAAVGAFPSAEQANRQENLFPNQMRRRCRYERKEVSPLLRSEHNLSYPFHFFLDPVVPEGELLGDATPVPGREKQKIKIHWRAEKRCRPAEARCGQRWFGYFARSGDQSLFAATGSTLHGSASGKGIIPNK
jgi:hypothetical protein